MFSISAAVPAASSRYLTINTPFRDTLGKFTLVRESRERCLHIYRVFSKAIPAEEVSLDQGGTENFRFVCLYAHTVLTDAVSLPSMFYCSSHTKY